MSARLLLVGGGKMGAALLGGWLAEGGFMPEDISIVEPDAGRAEALRSRYGVSIAADAIAADSGATTPDVVVLAVKPQIMDAVVAGYRDLVAPGQVFLSIAAGKTLATFEKQLGAEAAIVRAMPNTPAAVGRGITVLCANAPVDGRQKELCTRLMKAVGEVAWIEDEADMDAVTALSGSGPAYVFLLIEAMAAAGVKAGLAPDLAQRLARATVSGSGELARQADEPAATLRENVTSPGGTTAAALAVLMADDGMGSLLERAIDAGARRSRELAEG